MKVQIGIVTGQAIEKNLDGDLKVRMLQVQITEPEDVQGIQQVLFSGNDTAPDDGDTVYILEIDDRFKIAIGSDDGIEPTVSKGEKKIYSHLEGVIKAFMLLKTDGQMHLNGVGDYAVRFSKLETAYNELQNKWNTFAAAYVPGGPSALGTPPTALQSTGDISLSKVNNVELSS